MMMVWIGEEINLLYFFAGATIEMELPEYYVTENERSVSVCAVLASAGDLEIMLFLNFTVTDGTAISEWLVH